LNGHPVVDAAQIIPDADEQALDAKLLDIQTKSHHQVAVLTVPCLGGYAIEAYSLNAARAYGLGNADGDDGVLITVAPNEHKARIEVGYGLTPMLTDGQSSQIMQNEMVPRFRADDYVGGINAGVDGVAEAITPLTPEQLLVKQREEQARAAREAAFWASVKDAGLIVFLVAAFAALLFSAYRIATAPARRRKREAEEAAERERERVWAERRAEVERQRVEREKQRLAREAAEKRRFKAWYAALSPQEKKAYDDEQAEKRRKAKEAAKIAAEKRRKEEKEAAARRRRKYSYSSSSSSSYDYSSSSSSSSGWGSGGFSGGGGSFGGGGASGSW
jgi:uncharacterized membrane protein YgcG